MCYHCGGWRCASMNQPPQGFSVITGCSDTTPSRAQSLQLLNRSRGTLILTSPSPPPTLKTSCQAKAELLSNHIRHSATRHLLARRGCRSAAPAANTTWATPAPSLRHPSLAPFLHLSISFHPSISHPHAGQSAWKNIQKYLWVLFQGSVSMATALKRKEKTD